MIGILLTYNFTSILTSLSLCHPPGDLVFDERRVVVGRLAFDVRVRRRPEVVATSRDAKLVAVNAEHN
jgi:hypothetical protein